jgi:hypothetical protein
LQVRFSLLAKSSFMKNIILSVAVVFVSLIGFAAQPDHSIWDRYLGDYVSSSGTVDYKGMKLRTDTLDAYLKELMNNPVASDWTKNQKMAYYINAYNAYTVKFVLEKYPVESVKDISFSGKDIWNFRMVMLGGTTNQTLNGLENDILRKMGDARIHFAINCASYSCPKLLNKAYMPDKLNSQLTAATKGFINDTKHNVISEKKIQISELFSWYAADFQTETSTLIDFLNQYSTVTINKDAKIEYMPYNWSLND